MAQQTYFYNNGLPFRDIVKLNLDPQIKRVFVMKKASLIIIGGGVGEGKTTLGIEAGDYVNKDRGFPPIHLEKNLKNCPQYAYGGHNFIKKLAVCYEKNLPALVYDEAGDFSKRGTLSRFNIMLNRTFETYRAFKIVVILCLPEFNVLDTDLFNKKIPRLLLYCEKRTLSYGRIKGYGLDRMNYLRYMMTKLISKPLAYRYVTPNFRAEFKDLEPERSAVLDALSVASKQDAVIKADIKLDGLVTKQEICSGVGKAYNWVSAKLYNLKIKPVKVYKGKYYYDEGVLDILAAQIRRL